MGLFGNLKDAKMFEKGTPIKCTPVKDASGAITGYRNENLVLEITKTLVKKTQTKGFAFIAEFIVVESSNELNPVGSSCSWYQNLTDENVSGGAMKEFLGAVYGYDLKSKAHKDAFVKDFEPHIERYADDAADESKNPLKGKRLRCEAIMVKTKKNSDFTRMNWAPMQRAA